MASVKTLKTVEKRVIGKDLDKLATRINGLGSQFFPLFTGNSGNAEDAAQQIEANTAFVRIRDGDVVVVFAHNGMTSSSVGTGEAELAHGAN